MIIGKRCANPAEVTKIPEFSGVAAETIRCKLVELKTLDGIISIAKTFCEQWEASEESRFTPNAANVVDGLAEPTRPLAERKTLWMVCASQQYDDDKKAGRMTSGRKSTWMNTANKLHGVDARYHSETVRLHVRDGLAGKAPKQTGRPPAFPRKLMLELIQFVGMLRAFKSPVYEHELSHAARARAFSHTRLRRGRTRRRRAHTPLTRAPPRAPPWCTR